MLDAPEAGKGTYSMFLIDFYIKHSKDTGHEKGKGRVYRKQGRRGWAA